MMLKVEPITVVIIILIGLIPCAWIGGGWVEKKEQQKMPPKYQTINNTQYQTTKQESVQKVDQSQTMMLVNGNGTNIINFVKHELAKTNTTWSSTTNTRFESKTNTR